MSPDGASDEEPAEKAHRVSRAAWTPGTILEVFCCSSKNWRDSRAVREELLRVRSTVLHEGPEARGAGWSVVGGDGARKGGGLGGKFSRGGERDEEEVDRDRDTRCPWSRSPAAEESVDMEETGAELVAEEEVVVVVERPVTQALSKVLECD